MSAAKAAVTGDLPARIVQRHPWQFVYYRQRRVVGSNSKPSWNAICGQFGNLPRPTESLRGPWFTFVCIVKLNWRKPSSRPWPNLHLNTSGYIGSVWPVKTNRSFVKWGITSRCRLSSDTATITDFARVSQTRKTITLGECNVCNVCNIFNVWVFVCMHAKSVCMYVCM